MIEGGLSPRGVEVLDLFFRYVDMDVMYINPNLLQTFLSASALV